MGREAGANREFDGVAIEDRQHARHPHADRADVLVGPGAEGRGASAEQLRVGQQMGMYFESDYRFVCFGCHYSVNLTQLSSESLQSGCLRHRHVS